LVGGWGAKHSPLPAVLVESTGTIRNSGLGADASKFCADRVSWQAYFSLARYLYSPLQTGDLECGRTGSRDCCNSGRHMGLHPFRHPGWRRYSEPGARASCPITTFHSRWLHGQLETRRSRESLRDPFQCIVFLCPGSSGNTPDTVIVDPGFSTGRPKALQNQVFEIFEPRDSPMGSPWTSGGELEEKASHHDLPSGHNPGRVSSVGLKC